MADSETLILQLIIKLFTQELESGIRNYQNKFQKDVNKKMPDNRDVFVFAPTDSGKTFCFALLERLRLQREAAPEECLDQDYPSQ